jgi:hypothetical protein
VIYGGKGFKKIIFNKYDTVKGIYPHEDEHIVPRRRNNFPGIGATRTKEKVLGPHRFEA